MPTEPGFAAVKIVPHPGYRHHEHHPGDQQRRAEAEPRLRGVLLRRGQAHEPFPCYGKGDSEHTTQGHPRPPQGRQHTRQRSRPGGPLVLDTGNRTSRRRIYRVRLQLLFVRHGSSITHANDKRLYRPKYRFYHHCTRAHKAAVL